MSTLSKYLTYLGTIPFIGISYLLTSKTGDHRIELFSFDFETIISIYTISIVSFIAGSHWGYKANSTNSIMIPLSSNLIVLAVWISYLFLFFELFLYVSSTLLVLLLVVDKLMFEASVINKNYLKHRVIATSIVLLSFGWILNFKQF